MKDVTTDDKVGRFVRETANNTLVIKRLGNTIKCRTKRIKRKST